MPVASARQKAWALLAYTVADDKGGGSSLDNSVKRELRAICEAADFARLSIAAQVDFKRTPGVFRATLAGWPRDFEPAAPEDYPLWRKIVESVPDSRVDLEIEKRDLNAARPQVLRQFLQYGERRCPADRYVVFFYGHACGPMGLFYDTDTGRSEPTTLRLTDLAKTFDEIGQRAAIIIFRDCFMNTLETAYQLRSVGEYLVATQAATPIAGVWPWDHILAALLPTADSMDIAKSVAMHIASFLKDPSYRGGLADAPFSVIDLRAADAVAPPLKALTDALEAARGDARLHAACSEALEGARSGFPDDSARPGDPALIDVPTMCDRLQALHHDAISEPAEALGEVVRERLVRYHHVQKSDLRGISLYYRPTTGRMRERSAIEPADDKETLADARYYEQLALSKATGWHHLALEPLAP